MFIYKIARILLLYSKVHKSFTLRIINNGNHLKNSDMEMQPIENQFELDKKLINFRWRNVSMVLDRLFAVVFIILFASIAVILFPRNQKQSI